MITNLLSFVNSYFVSSMHVSLPTSTITQHLRIDCTDDNALLHQVIPLYNTNLCMTGGGATVVTMNTNQNLYTRRWYIAQEDGGYRFYNGAGTYVLAYQPYEEDESIMGSLVTQNSLDHSVWNLEKIEVLDVPLNQQDRYNTCGPASVLMILKYFGCYPSSIGEDLSERQFEINMYNTGVDIGNYTTQLNYYLLQGGSNKTYATSYDGDITENEFRLLLENEFNDGDPVLLILDPNAHAGFGYTAESLHFVVARGIYYDAATNSYNVVINDPHYNNAYFGRKDIPLSVLHTCCAAIDHWMSTTI